MTDQFNQKTAQDKATQDKATADRSAQVSGHASAGSFPKTVKANNGKSQLCQNQVEADAFLKANQG
jgi:hypothetical protein